MKQVALAFAATRLETEEDEGERGRLARFGTGSWYETVQWQRTIIHTSFQP